MGLQQYKNQNPRMKANVSGQILLTVNREGERSARMQAERSRLEEELAQVQRQLQQAQQDNSAVSEEEARQRQAELQEKVRRAKAEEAAKKSSPTAERGDGKRAGRGRETTTKAGSGAAEIKTAATGSDGYWAVAEESQRVAEED
ncbi:MAG: hypothetical protein QGH37_19910 [Candidatus Poribacteria bacterium]|nr:hypothetical protein [Candidatus Poribacteria bacterium]